MKVSDLSENARIMLWVRASLGRLVRTGLIEARFTDEITVKGSAVADQVLASDLIPYFEDVVSILRFLFKDVDNDSIRQTAQLMVTKAWEKA